MNILPGLCLSIYNMVVSKIYLDTFLTPREAKWGTAGWLPFIVWHTITNSYVWGLNAKGAAGVENPVLNLIGNLITMELTGLLSYKGNRWSRLQLPVVYMTLWMLVDRMALFGGRYVVEKENPIMVYLLISNITMLIITLGVKSLVHKNDFSDSCHRYNNILVLFSVGAIILYDVIYAIARIADTNKTEVMIWLSISALILLALDLCIYPIYGKLIETVHMKKNNSDYQKLINSYKNHIELEQTAKEEIERIKHDLKQGLIYLAHLLEHQGYEKMRDVLSKLLDDIYEKSYLEGRSGNLAVDSQINHLWQMTKKKNIGLQTDIFLSDTPGLDDLEMGVLLGNIFDNAIEASEKISRNREISVELKYNKGYLNLTVRNRYHGKLKRNARGNLISDKKGRHGIGLQSVEKIVNKYHGQIDIIEEYDIFKVEISLFC